jgi:putative transposase
MCFKLYDKQINFNKIGKTRNSLKPKSSFILPQKAFCQRGGGMKNKRRLQRYPSDLSKKEWLIIKPLLPPTHGNQELDLLIIVNAIFYIVKTGCHWRALPHEYPSWSSVYYHFAKWSKNGVLEAANIVLCKTDRRKRGRKETPTGALIDSQSVKTAKEAREVGFDGGKMIKGHKRHMLADTVGNMLNIVISAANISDIAGGKLLIAKVVDTFPTIEKIWADGTYRGEFVDWVHETLNAVLEVVQREQGQKGFKVQPKRWVVERTFAWLGNYRRLSKDYERLPRNSEAMIYLASIKTMLKRVVTP